MQSQAGSFIKGLGTGMVAGAAALVVGKVVMQDHKNITKQADTRKTAMYLPVFKVAFYKVSLKTVNDKLSRLY